MRLRHTCGSDKHSMRKDPRRQSRLAPVNPTACMTFLAASSLAHCADVIDSAVGSPGAEVPLQERLIEANDRRGVVRAV